MTTRSLDDEIASYGLSPEAFLNDEAKQQFLDLPTKGKAYVIVHQRLHETLTTEQEEQPNDQIP